MLDQQKLRHDLEVKLPDVRRTCTICTAFGDIYLDGDDARLVADLVRLILLRDYISSPDVNQAG